MRYEFLNDYLPDDIRINYKIIKLWFFSYSYQYCRGRIKRLNSPADYWRENESEHAHAYEQFNYSVEQPLEYLMVQVVALIVDCGRSPGKFQSYHRGEINKVLNLNKLESLFSMIDDEDELSDFKYDLKLLGFIAKTDAQI